MRSEEPIHTPARLSEVQCVASGKLFKTIDYTSYFADFNIKTTEEVVTEFELSFFTGRKFVF